MAGLKIVGEVLPQENNRVELADETDEYGLRIPRVMFSYGEEDKKLYEHAIHFMSEALEAAGGKDLWSDEDTAHLAGTCRMGTHPRDSVTNADGRYLGHPESVDLRRIADSDQPRRSIRH